MPRGQYDRNRPIGKIAIEAAREWIAQPDYAYRNLTAGGKLYAQKHGIGLTTISRARAILDDPALVDAVCGGHMSLHGAAMELAGRKEARVESGGESRDGVPVVPVADGMDAPPSDRRSVSDRLTDELLEAAANGPATAPPAAATAPPETIAGDRLRWFVDKMAELVVVVAVARVTARQGALERRLERDEKDGAALQELAMKGVRRSEAAAKDIERLEGNFERVMAAGVSMNADTAAVMQRLEVFIDRFLKSGSARKSDFPKGWRHLSEKKREEWRNGKADKG